MKTNKKKCGAVDYVSPLITCIDIHVEAGFAASPTGTIGDYTGSDELPDE